MIALHTNVPVRFLVQDDPEQVSAAAEVIDEFTDADPGFSRVVLVELVWVLERACGIPSRAATSRESFRVPITSHR